MDETVFYNVWRTLNAENLRRLVDSMRKEAPALAVKPGFESLTVWVCEADGRVIVEGRSASNADFEAAITHDPAALASRARLERFGSAEPGMFVRAFQMTSPAPRRTGA